MTILSWNMYFLNERQDEAFAFVRDSAYDVYCLQEVPPAFLGRLRSLDLAMAEAVEIALVREGRESRNYSVILSRFPMKEASILKIPNRDPMMPARGRAFIEFMYRTRLWKRTKNLGLPREVAVATLDTAQGPLRVASAHLSLTNPLWRREELTLVLDGVGTEHPAIIAGDFNIIESFPVSLINYFLGGSLMDTLRPLRERRVLTHLLRERGLRNPLSRMRTHAVSGSQLDHILVSDSLRIDAAHVIPQTYGSDHNPVEITLA